MENKIIKITLATSNPNKLEEFNKINTNKNIVFEVIKDNFNPRENGLTFEENAVIKAKEAVKLTGNYCIADDSGLCVDVLEGRPGIYSSRYAQTPQKRIEKLLNEMYGIPYDNRTAHFTCALVLVNPKGNVIHSEIGKVFGYINDCPKGANGFGYDPIFLINELDKTLAELSEQEKNQISHRSNALRPMLKWIDENIDEFRH